MEEEIEKKTRFELSIKDGIIAFVTYKIFELVFIGLVLLGLLILNVFPFSESTIDQIVEISSTVIGIIVLMKVIEKFWKKDYYEFHKVSFKVDFKMLILVIVFTISFHIVRSQTLSIWISRLNMPEIINLKELYFIGSWFTILSTVLIAPILEEMFYRGLLLEGLLRVEKPYLAIFFSSFIFGIMHVNSYQSLNAFFVGLALGTLYYKTRSLFLLIVAHSLTNGLVILEWFEVLNIDSQIYFILGSFIFIITIYLLWKSNTVQVEEIEEFNRINL